MTRDELARALADIERTLDERVYIVRVIVNADGTPTGRRIYSGGFVQRPKEKVNHE